eukprot:scaffold4920_cov129-Isochrysis_galbana.AAC.2
MLRRATHAGGVYVILSTSGLCPSCYVRLVSPSPPVRPPQPHPLGALNAPPRRSALPSRQHP